MAKKRLKQDPPAQPARRKQRDDFWTTRNADQLAQEQGITPIRRLDEMLGKGADLWKNDEDLERFVADVHERRREAAEK